MRWFEIALVLLTALTGVVWIVDKAFFARRRIADAGLLDDGKEPWYVDYAKAFFPVLAVVLVLRTFVAEPFRIPSSSMMPTLLIGDFILVNKFAYGLRLPINNHKVLSLGEPQRGDVVVFKPPHHPEQDWIKRVIGLPGDTIAYRDDTVTVNGKPLTYTDAGRYQGVGRGVEMSGAHLMTEQIAGHPHSVLERDDQPFFAQGNGEWTVPPGNYFVMGDNRDNSEDSRFWGFLPEGQLRGKAFMIWMHMDWGSGGDGFDLKRVGKSIP